MSIQPPKTMPTNKYVAVQAVDLPDRQWPSRIITKAPIWCSVDLRDGNQALIEPMGLEKKLRLFHLLVKLGFKEMEIGFPSASQTEYDFCRYLIENNLIPEDVTIQVLTQAREELIRRTFDALRGAKNAIVHIYNSTSTLQRRVVFGLDQEGIKSIAAKGTRLVKDLLPTIPETRVRLEYSPESFTGTELEFAKEISEVVMEAWGASAQNQVILNLPATVEMATPNVYADQIEWFGRNVKDRESYLISLHPHNDRGTGIAAAELGQMAGADRVEGTLFGNGERTGNVDLVTLALNLFTQGINPQLDMSNIHEIVETAEYCNQLPVHPRHPYAGDLVFTAFSGSHQDAIKKGLAALKDSNSKIWEVPYLPIDPKDIGRSYEAVIRVNSQSGKGGVAYLLQTDHGLDLPRRLQIEFSSLIQKLTDASGKEISSSEIWAEFQREFLSPGKYELVEHTLLPSSTAGQRIIEARIKVDGHDRMVTGEGNGPLAALVDALQRSFGLRLDVTDYREHAVSTGSDSTAAAYVEIRLQERSLYGVSLDHNILDASLKALLSAINRTMRA